MWMTVQAHSRRARAAVTNELLTSAAAERNKDPILTVLESVLPATGQRARDRLRHRPARVLSSRPRCPASAGSPPSPTKPRAKPSSTRIREAGLENVAQPIALDVRGTALARARTLRRRAVHQHDPHLAVARHARAVPRRRASCWTRRASSILYGPYLENGTAVQSNLDFDASLKRRNAEWGLRDLDEVTRVAAGHSFAAPADRAHAG